MIYIIVEAASTQGFVEEVNENIAKGFIPLGGVATMVEPGEYAVYAQAMTLEEVEVDKPTVQPTEIKVLAIDYNLPGIGHQMMITYSHEGFRKQFKTDKLAKDVQHSLSSLEVKMLCIENLEED